MSRSRRLPVPYIRNLAPVPGHTDLFAIVWEGSTYTLPASLLHSLTHYFAEAGEIGQIGQIGEVGKTMKTGNAGNDGEAGKAGNTSEAGVSMAHWLASLSPQDQEKVRIG